MPSKPTVEQLRKQLQEAEAAEAKQNGTNGATNAGLVFEDDVPKPGRTSSGGKSAWGIEADVVPMGKRVKLFEGACDASSHSGTTAAYIGKPFTVYALGRCGDFSGERMHKACTAPGKSACGGHVFDVRMADGRGGCTSCARKQRKQLEADKR